MATSRPVRNHPVPVSIRILNHLARKKRHISNTDTRITDADLDQIFREARTHSEWLRKPVALETLHEIYELARLGPTSANSSPGRFLFIQSAEAKERLLPLMSPGNVGKTRTAPVNVIVAYDVEFYERFVTLFPFGDMRPNFVGKDNTEFLLRSGSLEGAYFIIAARALGLDCGPMSGFDAAKVNAEFFPDGKWRANFVINLGYADREKVRPRSPRLAFDEACKIL